MVVGQAGHFCPCLFFMGGEGVERFSGRGACYSVKARVFNQDAECRIALSLREGEQVAREWSLCPRGLGKADVERLSSERSANPKEQA